MIFAEECKWLCKLLHSLVTSFLLGRSIFIGTPSNIISNKIVPCPYYKHPLLTTLKIFSLPPENNNLLLQLSRFICYPYVLPFCFLQWVTKPAILNAWAYSRKEPLSFAMSVRPSFCLHIQIRPQLYAFPRNLLLNTFLVIWRQNPNLVKIRQKYRAHYTKTEVRLYG
jgi:hypothetical protein